MTDARCGRNRNARGNARHDLAGNPRLVQCLNLFSTASKHKGIAAFQADDGFALTAQAHQQRIDFRLRHGMTAAALTRRIKFRLCRLFQQRRVDQVVVYHCITGLQQPQTAQRNQICAAAARPHQINKALFLHAVSPLFTKILPRAVYTHGRHARQTPCPAFRFHIHAAEYPPGPAFL